MEVLGRRLCVVLRSGVFTLLGLQRSPKTLTLNPVVLLSGFRDVVGVNPKPFRVGGVSECRAEAHDGRCT